MPIRPQHRWLYPIDWSQLTNLIRFELAKGAVNSAAGRTGRPYSISEMARGGTSSARLTLGLPQLFSGPRIDCAVREVSAPGGSIVIGSSDELTHLIERVAARDHAAFQTLYNATRQKLLKSALLIVRNPDDADELVQEAYIKVWTRAASYRRSAFSPISWLVAIVRNHALDHLRRRRVPQAELRAGNMVVDTGPNPELLAIRKNLTRVVLDQLDTLPQHKRDAITAVFFEGLTCYELASRQNVPVNTAKTHVYRALHDLRERMLMHL